VQRLGELLGQQRSRWTIRIPDRCFGRCSPQTASIVDESTIVVILGPIVFQLPSVVLIVRIVFIVLLELQLVGVDLVQRLVVGGGHFGFEFVVDLQLQLKFVELLEIVLFLVIVFSLRLIHDYGLVFFGGDRRLQDNEEDLGKIKIDVDQRLERGQRCWRHPSKIEIRIRRGI